MSYIIGDDNIDYHKETCNNCHKIIAFNNSDIIRDDMGLEIICPNCGHSIKF